MFTMVDFNNKWFRETCEQNGWNPDNIASQSAVDVARKRSKEMKMYMDAQKDYTNENLKVKIQEQIDRLNNERIEFMLNALFYAEVMDGLGEGFNQFLIKDQKRKEYLRRKQHVNKQ